MSGKAIKFTLDGKEVEARDGETIWQVAKREGTSIPHLCWQATRPATGPTAIAAPAWWRSRVSVCLPPPASASRATAWW
jgi:hypothetical protein